MSGFLESFFDENVSETFNLWSKDIEGSMDFSKEKVVHKGELYKYSRARKKWSQRYFVVTEKHLLYYKSPAEDRIRGIINLHLVRNVYHSDGHQLAPEYKYGIRFIKNMKFSDLWTKSEATLKAWQAALSKICVQSDFHIKFSAFKMIGRGSFARVYLVENQTTKDRFAVKAFSKEYLLSQRKGKESLLNEIEVMQSLDHENLMRLHEIHESQNSVYLVLELLEGGELVDFIKAQQNRIKVSEYKYIIRSILKALRYMSAKNIMHRDLKPENMILKRKGGSIEDNVLKIVDFGLATKCDISEYLFKRCGTPGYVAPEVVNASSEENIHYTPKCDVFSAGVIFYLILSGKSPFPGTSFKTILKHNKECNISYDIDELKNVPADAIDLLRKMLERNPQKRLSAAECLNHPFFNGSEKDAKDLLAALDGSNIGDNQAAEMGKLKDKYTMVAKNLIKPSLMADSATAAGSLEFRQACIHGNVDTYQEPGTAGGKDSKGEIDSMNYVNLSKSPTAKNTPSPLKKDNIYKATLKNANHINLQDYESFCSNNSSREEWDSKEPSPDGKRSRITYQLAECSPEKAIIKKSKFGERK